MLAPVFFAQFGSEMAKNWLFWRISLCLVSLKVTIDDNRTSVCLIDWKLKCCLSNSLFGPFQAEMRVQSGSKMAIKLVGMVV